jgi:uncharacterized surface protein with fasciclin (FAS1) repeats
MNLKNIFIFTFTICLPVHLLFPFLVQDQQLNLIQSDTLLETIKQNEELSVLYDLISSRPALRAALSLPKANITLIAPVNSAFDKEKNDPEELTEILLYHIINNAILVKDLEGLLESGLHLETLSGDNQKIVASKHDEETFLNGHVKIKSGDMIASNGVIHTTTKLL